MPHKRSSPGYRARPVWSAGLWLLAASLAADLEPAMADEAKLKAYGRHLARECTSCHRVDGVDNGIPSIIGWPPDSFIATMKFYRDGTRTNPVMMSVASSLSEEQVQRAGRILRFGAQARTKSTRRRLTRRSRNSLARCTSPNTGKI